MSSLLPDEPIDNATEFSFDCNSKALVTVIKSKELQRTKVQARVLGFKLHYRFMARCSDVICGRFYVKVITIPNGDIPRNSPFF